MQLKIVALFEDREQYEDIIIAYAGHNEVNISTNGRNLAIVEAKGTIDELAELIKLMPYSDERTIYIKGGG